MQRREEVRTIIEKKNSVTIYNCGSSLFLKVLFI